MAVKVMIPAPLRQFTGGQSSVDVQATTVGDALAALDQHFPGLRDRLVEPDGRLRRFVSVFVNGKDVRTLQGLETPLQEGDEVGIVPAMAGGR
ncbi:ubiquitin-like small modifier protein 1 [Thermorudis peleae]|jgi:molybdopterin synthase sulfur carrier subunit|uniref:ubiquitin-like small modifier protein 1 n=1 Tax=Thermorudis peleae TaxID=1382356 RepID=UPI000570776F|nr:ubiquitin-like small modifier protein 1 [Thermorudis peleae]MBX6754710.1 MoaD family protein [Thermorudis peleae]